MTSGRDILDRGELNQVGGVGLATGLGSVISGEKTYVRIVRETVAVAAAAAPPSYTVLQLLYARTIGTGAPAVKAPGINGAAPGAGAAAPNAGGTSIVFNAETTGTGTADIAYLTGDPPKGRKTLSEDLPGFTG